MTLSPETPDTPPAVPDPANTRRDDFLTQVLSGRLEPGTPDWVYLPVDVPPGVTELAVRYDYDRPAAPPGVPGNALDIGIFDPRGHRVEDRAGFRGWSGGARDEFVLSASGATPGYLPGPIQPGTWHIALGPYTVAPQGLAYRVEVTARTGDPGPPFVPSPAPLRAAGRGPAWYRGDLHTHTVHSDGVREPAELLASARAAGLDFVVSTEHNTTSAHGIWGHHVPDDLLVVNGEEVTTRNGHLVVAGLPAGTWVDWRFRAVDGVLPRVVEMLHGFGGLAIAAHPFCPYVGCAWKFGFAEVDVVEVWNGPWTPDDEVSLRQWDAALVADAEGRWLPAVGSSDTHAHDDAVGLGQTVVWAEDLTRDAILAGVRAGRSYVAESAAVEVTFGASADGRAVGIGERLPVASDTPVELAVTVRGVRNGFVRFVSDEGILAQLPLPALAPPESGAGSDPADDPRSGVEAQAEVDVEPWRVTWTTTAAVSKYVRVEVRHTSPQPAVFEGMAAFTNPIFLDADDPAGQS
ncbi:CehA/McbA family metallohydrolase [Actinopolymorpha sp. NPDC004070]|uniref:CehA/McbA family metallohydrolase n=1 Tax=Actinopolymorpha sp. NPDC004070 TaxID=3154548 RepID=UPI0033ACEEF8